MTRIALAIGALFFAAPLSAQAQNALSSQSAEATPDTAGPAVKPLIDAAGNPESFSLVRKQMEDCPGRKFDFADGDPGKGRVTKITLCTDSADKDAVASTLEKAIVQLETTGRMPAQNRAELIAKMRAKIAEVRAE